MFTRGVTSSKGGDAGRGAGERSVVSGRPGTPRTAPAPGTPAPLPVALKTGNGGIDQQHEVILETLGRMGALPARHGSEGTLAVLEHLRRHVASHFLSEEQLLPRDTPRGLDHLRDHQRLLSRLDDLIARVEDGQEGVAHEAQATLGQWLTDHIRIHDLRDFPRH